MVGVRIASLLLAAAALCCMYRGVSPAVIALDFGSEWIKIALVKPGVPMEIVLNKESKRKTAAVVALRNDERLFSDPALAAAVKYPKSAYWYLQFLVGQKFDSPLVKRYQEWFPYYDMKRDEERGTVLFQHDSETVFSPEELIAMIFNNSRHIAEDYAGQSIRDVVITVPPFFTQAQRRALLYASNLVGLNVLQLMTDTAAAALNYGIFRRDTFNSTPQYIMFYDMGAGSTTVTIVEYRKAEVREGGVVNTHPQLTVKGTGFDRMLGGFEMDIRLRDFLAKKFESLGKTKGSVYDSPRAMGKLLKEAQRLKRILSANTDHVSQVEGVLEDVDFSLKVSRSEFEALCSDLFDRVAGPVTEAMEAADMTMGEIDTVILVGGGTRVPKVQEMLLKAVNKEELGKNLNTDEAAAMGAVYQGAGLTKLFRVQKFIVKEGNIYPIQVSFSRQTVGEGGEETTKTVTRTLFPRSNAYPQKKVLTFNRYSNDFAFSVFYGNLGFLSEEEKSCVGRVNISEVFLVGVGDALKKHSEGETKGVKAHFRMDESGILHLDNVESLFEYPEEPVEQSTFSRISSTLSSLFGGGSSKTEEKGTGEGERDEGEEIPADQNETEVKQPGMEQGQEAEEPEPGSETLTPDLEEPEERVLDDEGEKQTEAEPDTVTQDQDYQPEGDADQGGDDQGGSEEAESVQDDSESSSTERKEEEEREEGGWEGKEEEEEEKGEEEKEEGGWEGEQSEGGEGKQEDAQPETEAPSDHEATPTATPTEEAPPTKPEKKEKAGKAKEKDTPKGAVVKVNITAELTQLDLPSLSDTSTQKSIKKLQTLQQRDEERQANEKAKNNLESHIFETQDAMYSEAVQALSTEEQRDVILRALREAADWLDEDGYAAETKVYKEKLRELKRVSRALSKRATEAFRRPKLIATLRASLNVSREFLSKMRSLGDEVQIFTEVEMTTLETLINETEEWIDTNEEKQEATPPHEDPVLFSYEIEEQVKRLDREVLYLLNKLRTHPPPKPKTRNATNATKSSTIPENVTLSEEDDESEPLETHEKVSSEGEEEGGEKEEEGAREGGEEEKASEEGETSQLETPELPQSEVDLEPPLESLKTLSPEATIPSPDSSTDFPSVTETKHQEL